MLFLGERQDAARGGGWGRAAFRDRGFEVAELGADVGAGEEARSDALLEDVPEPYALLLAAFGVEFNFIAMPFIAADRS